MTSATFRLLRDSLLIPGMTAHMANGTSVTAVVTLVSKAPISAAAVAPTAIDGAVRDFDTQNPIATVSAMAWIIGGLSTIQKG